MIMKKIELMSDFWWNINNMCYDELYFALTFQCVYITNILWKIVIFFLNNHITEMRKRFGAIHSDSLEEYEQMA